jgi:hypothetical protein
MTLRAADAAAKLRSVAEEKSAARRFDPTSRSVSSLLSFLM